MDVRQAAPWARAAGLTGLAANALLVAFYAVEAGRRPPLRFSLGHANDLVGSVSTGLMVPVALAISPDRWSRRLGLTSMTTLTLAGPALVAGLVPFRRQLPVVLTGFAGLSGWVVLTSRGNGNALPEPVSRLGVGSGSAVLAGGTVAAVGLLFPAGSRTRQAVFAVGSLPATVGVFALPVWFLRVGRLGAGPGRGA
ncbi:MAG TPA: hypothetical protein VFG13_05000 [Blastococcus sp.]|nr:hypothetical protein [Blastococcus sp.]